MGKLQELGQGIAICDWTVTCRDTWTCCLRWDRTHCYLWQTPAVEAGIFMMAAIFSSSTLGWW